MGPGTDIYSLGATLFHLLTGRTVFVEKDISKLLLKVLAGDIASPRLVLPTTPAALSAICMKALALKPEDRYASAGDLAQDIERWLADEPVDVWQEPWTVRWGRWMRRNRTVVSSTAAALGVTFVAFGIGLVLLTAANARERSARNEAQQAYTTARRAVDEYYVRVSEDELLDQPGMSELRKALLTQALAYYQQFLAQGANDSTLQDEVAQTHLAVGELLETVASPEEALPSYDKAIDLLRRLKNQPTADVDRQEVLADALNARGRALDLSQRSDDAVESFQEAATLRQRLADSRPNDPERQRKLANTLMNLGLVERGREDLKKARQFYDQAQTIRLAALDRHAQYRPLRNDLAQGYYNQAVLSHTVAALEQAETQFQKAAEAFEHVLERSPSNPKLEFRLGLTYRLLADVNAELERTAPAEELYQAAADRFRQLVYHFPTTPDYQAALANVHFNWGVLIVYSEKENRWALAEEHFKAALTLWDQIVEQHPQSAAERDQVTEAIESLREQMLPMAGEGGDTHGE